MRVSVIILNWKRPHDTVKAVESVLAQDHPDFEVLVWDNDSGDGSRGVLETRFAGESRVRLHFSDRNLGHPGGRNAGARLATGQVIQFMDSDAWLENRDALSRIAERLADPSIGAVSFEVKRPDGHLMWPFARPAAAWRDKEFDTKRVDGCGFAITRRAWEAAGPFPEHFGLYGPDDLFYGFRLIACGFRIVYLPSVVVVHAFAPTGRIGTQFVNHTRNNLWIPLELFPFPQALLSAGRQAASLLNDAIEQRQLAYYARGVGEALWHFRLSRRRPIPRDQWRRLRSLMAEDKRLAGE